MTSVKRRRRWWILGFFVLVAGGIVALILSNGKKPVRVHVVRPKTERVAEIVTANSVGTVESEMTSTISSEISGRVVKIAYGPGRKDGSRVSFRPLVLWSLVPAATIDVLPPVVHIAPQDIAAEWNVTNSDIEAQERRCRKLAAELKRLRGIPDEPVQNVERLEHELYIAEAMKATLEAQLKIIELRMGKTEVRPPFAGLVSKLHVELGESVTPGKSLFTVLSDGPLLVRAPIDEVDRPRVRLGQRVSVSFDGYSKKCGGSVREILATASTDQKNNRTIDIKVSVDDMPAEICAGMSAHVEVIVQEKPDGLSIATHLVHESRGGNDRFVYLVENGVARKRKVKTGLSNWETVEIVEGLATSDQVLSPLNLEEDQTIAEGTKVEVVP